MEEGLGSTNHLHHHKLGEPDNHRLIFLASYHRLEEGNSEVEEGLGSMNHLHHHKSGEPDNHRMMEEGLCNHKMEEGLGNHRLGELGTHRVVGLGNYRLIGIYNHRLRGVDIHIVEGHSYHRCPPHFHRHHLHNRKWDRIGFRSFVGGIVVVRNRFG